MTGNACFSIGGAPQIGPRFFPVVLALPAARRLLQLRVARRFGLCELWRRAFLCAPELWRSPLLP